MDRNPLSAKFVRQTAPTFASIRWARSATKHRISRERSFHVIEEATDCYRRRTPGRDPRLIFVGDDREGIALEVIVVLTSPEEGLVIHAMPLRNRYRAQYEEVGHAEEAD